MGFNFNASANNSILEEVFRETSENKNAMITKNVSMDLIDMNPDNEKIFNMNKIEHLARIIAEDEFIGAIDVYKKADGRYEISGGHRRYLAEKMNGKTEICCNIMEEPDAITKAKRFILSNFGGRDMLPMDYARSIDYYKENVLIPLKKQGKKIGSMRAVLSKQFGISESKVQMYLDLLKLIPELRDYADNPDFPFSRLWSATSMSEDNQREVYKMISQIHEESQEGKMTISADKVSSIITEVKHKEELKIRREEDALKRHATEKKESLQTENKIQEEASDKSTGINFQNMNKNNEFKGVETENTTENKVMDEEIKIQAYRLIKLLKEKKNIKDVNEVNRVLDDVKTQINIYKEM